MKAGASKTAPSAQSPLPRHRARPGCATLTSSAGGERCRSSPPKGVPFAHRSGVPIQCCLTRPRFIGVLTVIAAGWISLNLLAAALGYRPIDPPPFPGLGLAVSLVSLYIVVMILATQRREYQLAQLREQLTLELAILSEQKTAKVIQLLEESRRDNPLIRDRVDQEAESMAQPADPQSVLDAIEETHAEAEQISGGADGP